MTTRKLPLILVLMAMIVTASFTITCVSEAQAGSGLTLTAYAGTPPTIDGNIQAAEWAAAATATFGPLTGGYTGTLYMMNDGTNLYLAVQVDGDADLVSSDIVAFLFDNNHLAGGTQQVGDDSIWLNGFPTFFDEFWTGSVWGSDSGAGGTTDGQGAVARQGSSNHFELSHPLDDADNAHDFSLSAGQTVGFCLYLNVNGAFRGLDSFNLGAVENPSTYANYIVASPRTLPPPPNPVGGVVLPTSKIEIVAPFAALAGLIVAVSTVVLVKKRRN